MKDFKGISFKWTFRDYQQRVLDNSQKFIADGKVNIVAAPGSGKTILGLEIIKRLGKPCLIFSPTTTIKQQWADRFEEAYLPEGEKIDDYVSFDLNNIKLLNSITYQALHSAIDKVAVEGEEENLNYADFLFLTDGAKVSPDEISAYERIFNIFDGNSQDFRQAEQHRDGSRHQGCFHHRYH